MLTVAKNCRRDFSVFSAGLFGFLGRLWFFAAILLYNSGVVERHTIDQTAIDQLSRHSRYPHSLFQYPRPPSQWLKFPRHLRRAIAPKRQKSRRRKHKKATPLQDYCRRWIFSWSSTSIFSIVTKNCKQTWRNDCLRYGVLSLHYSTGGRHSNTKE